MATDRGSIANGMPVFCSALRESSRAITDLTPEIIIKAKEVLKLNTQGSRTSPPIM